MKKSIALFAFLICALYLQAQQPPQQLPSLLDETMPQTPILHANEKPETIIHKYVYVKAVVNKKTAYVGEPLLVDYKLYTAINNRARVSKQPYFSGCSVMELSSSNDPHLDVINGKQYNVFTIRKVQVIPLQEGTLQLGQAYVENVIPLVKADGSGLENFSATMSVPDELVRSVA